MTLNIGLIGCGHIAKFHARNIRDAINRHGIDCRYEAVCDRNEERAKVFAGIAGCGLATTEPRAVIDLCDIVYVCTETSEHPALVEMAVAAGRHIFCEKPLATGLSRAQQMTRLVAEAGIVHQVGLVLHFSPLFTVLADLMKGDFGPLLSAHMRDDQFFPIRGHYASSWRADVARAGGGTLLEHSIHDVDLFRHLFGEVRSVHCHTRETSGHRGIEDVAEVSFLHEAGHTTTLSSIWHSIDTRASSRSLEVIFERARFTTDQDYFGAITCEIDDRPAVTLSSDEVLARYMSLMDLNPADEDLRSLAGIGDRRFLECALGGTPAMPDFHTALKSHEIVDACYRSAAEDGSSVALMHTSSE